MLTLWDGSRHHRQRNIHFGDCEEREFIIPFSLPGSHLKTELYDIKEWSLADTVWLISEENDDEVYITKEEKENLMTKKTIKKIHELTNHKGEKGLNYAYKTAGIAEHGLKKRIKQIVKACKVCKKHEKSKPRPKSTLPKASDFNEIVSFDLKFFTEKNKIVLWCVDACTRFIRGIVIKDKEAETVVRAIHENWICELGWPSIGFWFDNGREFINKEMEEFATKFKLSIKAGAAYSPWSNGSNERNHASADVIIKKILEEDRTVSFETAVKMATWTHNSNPNATGFSPLQLVTGKGVNILGISYRDTGMES